MPLLHWRQPPASFAGLGKRSVGLGRFAGAWKAAAPPVAIEETQKGFIEARQPIPVKKN